MALLVLQKHKMDHLTIPIYTSTDFITVHLFANDDKSVLERCEDAPEKGMAEYQVSEWSRYPYQITSSSGKKYQFSEEDVRAKVVERTKGKETYKDTGTIITGNNVGLLQLSIVEVKVKGRGKGEESILETIREAAKLELEVRSSKFGYETDYRIMMDDITKHYSELVMESSNTTHYFKPSPEKSAQTLYSRFAFVKSIIESNEFGEALHKIASSPIRRWTQTTVKKDLTSIKRLTKQGLRQIASLTNRIEVQGPPIIPGIDTLPKDIEVSYKKDTVDTPENRFVKFVLKSFSSFCSAFLSFDNADYRLKKEARSVSEKLQNYLSHSFFKSVLDPSIVSLNSPALQRKDGYREVFHAWIFFDVACKLNWKGGDDVFSAGKKNIATLYEYWLFFKLTDIMGGIFNIKSHGELIEKSDNDIYLLLKQGCNR